jgi:hypothetical protein
MWSIISKSLLGVITGLIAYLTPVLKRYIDQVITEKQLSKLDSYIMQAIKSNMFLLDWYFKDQKIDEDERNQFVIAVTADVKKLMSVGKFLSLQKTFKIEDYIKQQCNAAMLDFTIEHKLHRGSNSNTTLKTNNNQ